MATSGSDSKPRFLTLDEAREKGSHSGRYDFQKFIGNGQFGAVFLAKDTKARGRLVAVKFASIGGGFSSPAGTVQRKLTEILGEAKTLFSLRHGTIVGYETQYSFDGNNGKSIAIVTEYCPNGNLNEYLLKSCPKGLPWDVQLKFMLQMATGVQFIHSRNFTHRDLKPDNILLDKQFNIKIADFGFAKAAWDIKVALVGSSISLGEYMSTWAGTGAFMAPEVHAEHYTNASDIFSMAVVFLCITQPEMFRGMFPNNKGNMESKVIPLTKRNAALGRELHGNTKLRALSACDEYGIGDKQLRRPLIRLFDQMLLHTESGSRPSAGDVIVTLKSVDDSLRMPIALDTAAKPDLPFGCCL